MKTGKRSAGKHIVVFIKPNGLVVNRLGVMSTRRVGNAVERNRQKRLVREAYRLMKPELSVGYDIVIIPRVPWSEPLMQDMHVDLHDNILRAMSKFDVS